MILGALNDYYINPLDLSKKDMTYFNFEHKVMAPFQPRPISIIIFSVKS